ncbi:MAG: hypothetical protein K2K87_07430 [Lachnospiraceae bacterium]|nr:hypothetical protein [Lachnospiraceae bacterium]
MKKKMKKRSEWAGKSDKSIKEEKIMMNMNEELMAKARGAKSAEELLALAKENNVELTEEQANAYFEQMNRTGELEDDELDSVAGGGCHNKGVTDFHSPVSLRGTCSEFKPKPWLELNENQKYCKYCEWGDVCYGPDGEMCYCLLRAPGY